jgi:hypothetical protein
VDTGTADEQGDQQPPKLPSVQKHKPSTPATILEEKQQPTAKVPTDQQQPPPSVPMDIQSSPTLVLSDNRVSTTVTKGRATETAAIDAELERLKMRMQTIADQLNEQKQDNEIHSAQFPNAHPAHSNLPHTYIPHNDHPTPHAHSFDPPSHYVYPPNAYPPNAYPPIAYPPNAYPSHPYTPHAYSPYAFLPHAHPPIAYPPLAYAPHAYAPNANNAPHYRYHQLPPSTEISNYPYGYVDETRIRREERMNAILQLKEQEIKELRQKEYIRNG